jgi:hypothetical protein
VKVHVIGQASQALSTLIHCLREQGHGVFESDSAAPDADVYLFRTSHEMMKRLTHGLVVLDLRDDPDLQSAAWIPYADLCLVVDAATRANVVTRWGFEPERIWAVPDDEALVGLLDQAVRDGLRAANEKRGEHLAWEGAANSGMGADRDPCTGESLRGETVATRHTTPDESVVVTAQEIAALSARLEAASSQADVMLRSYRVRSKLPFVGWFVAWVRRNLTSHLREPYLDPTLERQVALNRALIGILHDVLRLQADLEARVMRLEEDGSHEHRGTGDH